MSGIEQDKFEIGIDARRSVLRVTMRGNWTGQTITAYKHALGQAVQQMRAQGCAAGDVLALVDTRETGAQSQQVVADYKQSLGGPDLVPRRLATLVSSALLKRQVERIGIANQRLFTDEAAAVAWLFEPSTEPA